MKRYIKADTIDILDEDNGALRALAIDPNTRPATLARIAEMPNASEDLKADVANNPNTPGDTLAKLLAGADTWLRHSVLQNPNTPESVILNHIKAMPEGVEYVKPYSTDIYFILQRPNLNVAICQCIMDKFPPSGFRYAPKPNSDIARSKNTPAEILSILAQDSDASVRRGVASNPNTSPADLAILAQDPDKYVQEAVAANRNISSELVSQLQLPDANHINNTLSALLRNKNCPAEVLSKYADNPRYMYAVATHRNTPVEALYRIYDCASADNLRPLQFLTYNVNLPHDLQQGILQLTAGSNAQGNSIKINLATNAGVAPDILAQLAKDPKFTVREAVARNVNTPAEILAKLAKDRSDKVRYAVAKNSSVPYDAWSKLAQAPATYSAARYNFTHGDVRRGS